MIQSRAARRIKSGFNPFLNSDSIPYLPPPLFPPLPISSRRQCQDRVRSLLEPCQVRFRIVLEPCRECVVETQAMRLSESGRRLPATLCGGGRRPPPLHSRWTKYMLQLSTKNMSCVPTRHRLCESTRRMSCALTPECFVSAQQDAMCPHRKMFCVLTISCCVVSHHKYGWQHVNPNRCSLYLERTLRFCNCLLVIVTSPETRFKQTCARCQHLTIYGYVCVKSLLVVLAQCSC